MTDIRLAGAANRFLFMASNGPDQVLFIEFAEGEDLPAGELIALATDGEDEIELVPEEDEESAGILVTVPLYVEDFDDFGSRDWQLLVAVQDDGSSGSEDDVRYILFTGLLRFSVVVPPVITSTTFQPLGS
jgi:hypothetical protein